MNTQRPTFLLILLALTITCAQAQNNAAGVVVSPAIDDQITTRLETIGESRALRSITLYPDSSGTVTQMAITANQRVDAGEPLLILDQEDERLELELARVRLADAERLLDRYERTLGTGAFPDTTIDTARRDAELARLERDQAALALADRTLLAPFTGHVGFSDIEPGERVDENTPITTLDDRRTLIVRFSLPEKHFGDLSPGDTLSLSPWSQPGEPIAGSIRQVATRIDESTGTFALEATVPNDDDRLRPGMRFRITLTLPGDSVLRVPETALQWGDDGAYVWVVREGEGHRVAVDLLGREPGFVLIAGGISAGENVVTEGTQRMRPGIAIRVIDGQTLDDYPAINAERRQDNP